MPPLRLCGLRRVGQSRQPSRRARKGRGAKRPYLSGSVACDSGPRGLSIGVGSGSGCLLGGAQGGACRQRRAGRQCGCMLRAKRRLLRLRGDAAAFERNVLQAAQLGDGGKACRGREGTSWGSQEGYKRGTRGATGSSAQAVTTNQSPDTRHQTPGTRHQSSAISQQPSVISSTATCGTLWNAAEQLPFMGRTLARGLPYLEL